MEKMGSWFGHAVRRLKRDPAFALLSIGTMAVGIGATVAIFTVVDAVLLEPLPYDAPDRLVTLTEAHAIRGTTGNVMNPGNLLDVEAGVDGIAEAAGIVLSQSMVLDAGDEIREVPGQYVTPNFFRLLGLEPAVGPGFSAEASMATPELMLDHGFWTREFGADPAVVGRTFTVNGEPVRVAGVLPRDFLVWGDGAAFYTSITLQETGDQTSTGRFVYGIARLVDGVDVERVQAEGEAVFAGLREAYPDFNAGWSVEIRPMRDTVVGDARRGLWVLLGAVGMLLLIACTNVANLFLSRATERSREMAVRTSLGATGGVLARQLLGEALVLAGLGGAIGVAMAWGGTRLMAERLPSAFALPRVEHAGVDATVLLFAVAVSILTGCLFALVPAMKARRTEPARVLAAEGRGPSRATGRVRNGLVVLEVALSMMLLVGAGLVARGFVSLLERDPGMRTEGVLTARLNLTVGRTSAERVAFWETLMPRLADRPGVEAAGAITILPLGGFGAGTSYHEFGNPPESRDQWPVADIRNVAGDYFGAMGIRILEGRNFDAATDVAGGAQVVVVNRALAEELFPGESAVGEQLAINWGPLDAPWEIVGVVEDVPQRDLSEEIRGVIYHPYAQAAYFPWMHLAIRTAGPPLDFAPELREMVTALDPSIPVAQVETYDQIVRRSVARPRMTVTLMLIFGTLAALLASVGLYGVLSWTVTRRVREIGVRMAIGANGGSVLGLVVRQGMTLALAGLAIGSVGAVVLGRVLESLLFGLGAQDPTSFLGAAGLLGAVALLACLFPAWRATRVAPADALRSD